MKMGWWGKMRKVWAKVAKSLHFQKTGLVKLREEVETCAYEDVHILWEMLKRNDKQLTGRRDRPFWVQWAKCAPLLCHGSRSCAV